MAPYWLRFVHVGVVAIFVTINLLNAFLTETQSNEATGAPQEEHRNLRTIPTNNTTTSSKPATVPVASNEPIQPSNVPLSNTLSSTTSKEPIQSSGVSLSNTEPSTASTKPIQPSSDYAYVYFVGGLTTTSDHQREQTNKDGFLYNIMVSTQILKESGSTADFVLLVHTVEANVTLPAAKASMLEKLGIQIQYTKHSGLDPTNYFGSIALEKFRVFSWHEYSRILVMDADVMPHCNLDYLFHKSLDGTLQENVLVSIGDQPASPSFFLIKPEEGRYEKFLNMISHIPSQMQQRNLIFSPSGEWTSLKRMEDGLGIQTKWNFDGLESDAGLLYAFMRFRLRKGISVLVGDKVYTLTGGRSQSLGKKSKNPIRNQSCLKHLGKTAIKDTTYQAYQQKKSSSYNLAPYMDIAMWSLDEVQPWNIVDPSKELVGATNRWFKVLTSLSQQHNFGIGLEKGIFMNEQQQSQSSSLVPLAGIRHQALKDWGRHQEEQARPETHGDATPLELYAQQPKAPYATKRAFVCVTGQVERMELKNKIKKLLLPIQEKGYRVDLALVVADGESAYTNNKSVSRAPFYASFAGAMQALKGSGVNLLTTSAYAKIENPPFNQEYFKRLHKNPGKRTEASQKDRVLNHARIFDSYTRCWKHAEQAVQEAGGRMDDYYDVFFRIRDDVGFEEDLPEPVLDSLLQPSPGSIQVTGCRGWYGMNDRFASVSPSIAKIYFTLLHQNYISGQIQDGVSKVYNPETFLITTFAQAGIHVLAHRELRGLSKLIKDEKGKKIFAPEDVEKPFCFVGDPHLNHLIDLYGWSF